jgi:RHS repeat-associated protein
MTDSNGTTVWLATYEPFGNATVMGNITNNLRMAGQYYDQETNLHYNWNRYYDPRVGRYITSDPIGLLGGLNTYSYVYNNPLRWTDPKGLCVACAVEGIAALCARFSAQCAVAAAATAEAVTGAVSKAGKACGDAAKKFSDRMLSDGGDTADKPPAGSLPIDQTPWSGDHKDIKDGIGAGPADNVKISPDGDVWVQNPDGSWTNGGPAGDYTGSGKPSGRRGNDRDR